MPVRCNCESNSGNTATIDARRGQSGRTTVDVVAHVALANSDVGIGNNNNNGSKTTQQMIRTAVNRASNIWGGCNLQLNLKDTIIYRSNEFNNLAICNLIELVANDRDFDRQAINVYFIRSIHQAVSNRDAEGYTLTRRELERFNDFNRHELRVFCGDAINVPDEDHPACFVQDLDVSVSHGAPNNPEMYFNRVVAHEIGH